MLLSQERKLFGERLRQLKRLGLSIPLEGGPYSDQRSEVVVEQTGIDLDSPVVDLPEGRTLFVVWVSFWAERPGIRLFDYRFEPPWPDRNFQPLPGFADSSIGQAYVLPNGLAYPRGEILNFNFLKTGWRLPNTRVDGVLCALSETPIPEEYRHGASIPVGVKFFSKSGQQLAATSVVLWADRWDARALTRSTAQPSVALDDPVNPGVSALPPRTSVFKEIKKNDLSTARRHRVPLAAESTSLSNSLNRNSFNRSPAHNSLCVPSQTTVPENRNIRYLYPLP